ncbi:MAG: transposase [Candidatus Endonucleobacter bathymodioli]|uniref:Transposase n=1 Tax=Candidatus Endonucleibacter bathymodioli TaxID=539814 RepID=A0AA90NZP9_9GAMM|nr:transposase [Candidatus Endonucleobacter bathymodioli]
MKIHVGADVNSSTAHTVTVTPANKADIGELPTLLRENDEVIFGDAGCIGLHWKVNHKR